MVVIKIKKIKKRQILKVKYRMSESGFSLIEVMIAIFVLSLGLVAISFLMVNNIKSSENSKNQIIASQLAQEGIELVRNMKDGKIAALDNLSAGSYVYMIDTAGTFIENNSDPNKFKLYLNNFFYTHESSGGTPTKFYRSIYLDITGDKDHDPYSTREIKVTAYVSWNGKGFIDELQNVDATKCTIGNKCLSVVSVLSDY